MNSELAQVCEIRDGKPEDVNFIIPTFLKGLYFGDSWFAKIPESVFMENYKPVVLALLRTNAVKVAVLKEDPDIILGYSILSPDYLTIHWVFCKKSWRQKGIAKALLPQFPNTVTHLTNLGERLLPKFQVRPIFNPFFKG